MNSARDGMIIGRSLSNINHEYYLKADHMQSQYIWNRQIGPTQLLT